MSSTSVTSVILGLLALGPRSGYEIKTTVDRSTRFFWAASYGQIYPELRPLERDALVPREDSPNGVRARRLYRLTDAGRDDFRRWLLGTETTEEVPDDNLLRFFFADTLPRDEALLPLEGRRLWHEALAARLREIDELPGDDPPFVDLVLRWGIAYSEWGA